VTVGQILILAAVAAVVCGFLAPAVLALLRRGHVLDHATARSSHVGAVPRGGGVAPAAGALLALALAPSLDEEPLWAIAAAAAVFGILGLIEDVVGVRALYRLAIQFVAAGGVAVLLLATDSSPSLMGVALGIVGIFWVVAFVNAFNFMDGIDGISVVQAVGAGVTWAIIGVHVESAPMAAGGAVVAGAALGFAPFNVPRARMFLGDVGSYFIGAWLASVAVLGLRGGVTPEAVLAPLALYVADTGTTLVRRAAQGQRWYLPHRDHAYQRLGDAGWSHIQTSALVGLCVAACGALGAVSLTGSVATRVIADVVIVGVVGAYLLMPRWLAGRRREVVAV
jgi:UDP-GlcNAc:undecaprenyl-phosphate GlcNAc-1-phosphate transferase